MGKKDREWADFINAVREPIANLAWRTFIYKNERLVLHFMYPEERNVKVPEELALLILRYGEFERDELQSGIKKLLGI